jgi:hypothetical protein
MLLAIFDDSAPSHFEPDATTVRSLHSSPAD